MPSGFNDTIVDAVLDKLFGASADTSIIGGTNDYLDFLTTAPSDDNGTGAVSWGQGRATVARASGTNWPAASGRVKTSVDVTMPANSSGGTITVVALAWYSASSGGTYRGGGPVPGGSLDIPDGTTPVVTAALASPPPS